VVRCYWTAINAHLVSLCVPKLRRDECSSRFVLVKSQSRNLLSHVRSRPFSFLVSATVFRALSATAELDTAAVDAQFNEQEKTLSAVITKMPRSINLLSKRGDARLFQGNFAGAVADYEEMIVLDPSQDAPHWRLGIARYFCGDFAAAAAQFEKYHAYDSRDRENGVWKFFCQARAENLEAARRGLLVYTQFDREPFPDIYELLKGKLTTAALFTGLEEKGLGQTRQVQFFAKYYAGLYEVLFGDKAQGTTWLREAVGLFDVDSAERSGPGYMWHAARLQLAALR